MSKTRQCFVISPIGKEGSPEREHANDVFDFIIKPAMKKLGIQVYRSDHSQQIGRITDQMFTSILGDDLCIAVLTFRNANVFYELAVAHCAAKPVIILVEKGTPIPFDVSDHRAVEYDLRPRPLRDRVYVDQIVEIVGHLEKTEWAAEVPFGKGLSPLGSGHRRLRLYDKVEEYGNGKAESWMEVLRGATSVIDLSGLSLRWWTKLVSFEPLILQKAEQGCKVRFLLMHPENPALPQFINDRRKVGGMDLLASEIKETYSRFAHLATNHPNIEARWIRRGCLSHQIVRNDNQMLLTLLLYSQGTSQSPLLECASASVMYKTLLDEFDTLWSLNGPETATPTRPTADAKANGTSRRAASKTRMRPP